MTVTYKLRVNLKIKKKQNIFMYVSQVYLMKKKETYIGKENDTPGK